MRNYISHSVSLSILIGVIVGIIALTNSFAQEDEPEFEMNYLGYDDIYREFKKGKCRSCHPAIWREWEKSMHGQAWNDPIFQEAANKVPDREKRCDVCHAPEPILITGIGVMPKRREADHKYGVSCLVCHIDAHGAMHGPAASIDAMFHANKTSETHTNPTALCGTCHGQEIVPEHNQLASFKESPAAQAGKNCASCHMPYIKRLQSTASYEPIAGRRHTWVGSRSVAMLKRGADLKITFDAGKATVALTNKAGHILPGEALRTIILEVKIAPLNGGKEHHMHVFHSVTPGKDGSDNRIPPGKTQEFVYDVSSKATIEAKLRYRLLPTTPKAEWVTMAEVSEVAP
jgi:hypothetical protein